VYSSVGCAGTVLGSVGWHVQTGLGPAPSPVEYMPELKRPYRGPTSRVHGLLPFGAAAEEEKG
jgi:hypothetical protein